MGSNTYTFTRSEIWTLIGVIIGLIGVYYAYITKAELNRQKRNITRKFWALAKSTHITMGRIENVRKMYNEGEHKTPELSDAIGRAYGSSENSVKRAVENILDHKPKYDEEEIKDLKDNGTLNGFLENYFRQLLVTTPQRRASLFERFEKGCVGRILLFILVLSLLTSLFIN